MIHYWHDHLKSISRGGFKFENPSQLYDKQLYDSRYVGLQDLRFEALKDLLDNHCRNIDKGKPIKPSGLRLFYADSDKSLIRVMHYNDPLFSVDSNNILTWEMRWLGGYMQTTAMCQYNPIALYRLGTNNYSVVTLWDKYKGRNAYELPYVFHGLKYNLLTGEYLNAKFRNKTVEKPEQRKQWRKLLSRHKKVLKTTVVLGAVKSLGYNQRMKLQNHLRDKFKTRDIPWNRRQLVEYVLGVMKSDTLPQEYINMLRYHYAYYQQIGASNIESFFSHYGTAMKEYLGVYETIGFTNDKPRLNNDAVNYSIDDVVNLFSKQNLKEE
tara:strand:- start:707 stop:1678 length:972 start_codon:yes stop_codon:yes gene_type:complete